MAWRWTGAKPLSGTVKPYHELDPSEQEQTNINFPSKYNNFTKENDYHENVVCKMSAILSRPQGVNLSQAWSLPEASPQEACLAVVNGPFFSGHLNEHLIMNGNLTEPNTADIN